MTIDDAEIIFDKRWNNWSEEEWSEFFTLLSPRQLRIPAILSKLITRVNEGDPLKMLPSETFAQFGMMLAEAFPDSKYEKGLKALKLISN